MDLFVQLEEDGLSFCGIFLEIKLEVEYLHGIGEEGLYCDDVGEELSLVYVFGLFKLTVIELLPVFREMSYWFLPILLCFRVFLFRFVENVKNPDFLLIYFEVQGLGSFPYFFD